MIYVSFSIFLQSWLLHSHTITKHRLHLGALYLAIGLFGLMEFYHSSMPFFNAVHISDVSLRYWFAARLTESVGFILIFSQANRIEDRARKNGWFILSLVFALSASYVLQVGNDFPSLIETGPGYLSLPKILEIFIGLIYLAAIGLLVRQYWLDHQPAVLTLVKAVIFFVFSSIFFVVYSDTVGSYNLMGHLFKAAGYFWLMKGIYFKTFEEPYVAEKQTEKALIEAESKLRIIIVESIFCKCLIQNDKIVIANIRMAELLGYSIHELQAKDWTELVYDRDQATFREKMNLILAGVLKEVNFQVRFYRRDGQLLFVEVHQLPAVSDSKPAMMTLIIDITKRKLAEEALQRSEERFRNAFDNAPIGMAIQAINGRWIQVNNRMCEMLGYSESELLSINHWDITHFDDIETAMSKERLLTCGEAKRVDQEKRYFHKKGHIVWVKNSTSLIRDEQGNPLYFICQIQDIFVEKQLEEMRKQRELLLEKADKLSTVGQMVASVTHEIRNPLTTVRGFIQLLNDKTNRQYDSYFKLILGELDRANGIISDFLSLSQRRIDEKVECSLNEIVRSMHPMLVASTNMKGQYINLDLDEQLPSLLLNDKEMKQVLLNLSRNGMEAMTQGGTLTLSTRVREGRCMLEVADTGCGIPEELMDKLYEPFFTTKDIGTGLGLPICLSIVQRNGGIIEIESKKEVGTKFVISFPIRSVE